MPYSPDGKPPFIRHPIAGLRSLGIGYETHASTGGMFIEDCYNCGAQGLLITKKDRRQKTYIFPSKGGSNDEKGK
jgi:hypothetical protein